MYPFFQKWYSTSEIHKIIVIHVFSRMLLAQLYDDKKRAKITRFEERFAETCSSISRASNDLRDPVWVRSVICRQKNSSPGVNFLSLVTLLVLIERKIIREQNCYFTFLINYSEYIKKGWYSHPLTAVRALIMGEILTSGPLCILTRGLAAMLANSSAVVARRGTGSHAFQVRR
jgi:hypothetical protein